MIDDIEDDYPEFLDEQRGYVWEAWDILTIDEIRRHDTIAAMPSDALDALDPAGLNDLELWAYALARRNLGDPEGFLDAVRLMLVSEEEHRAVDYVDVRYVAIEAMAQAQVFDEAQLHLEQARERFPENKSFALLGAMLELRQDRQAGLAAVDALVATEGDDPELMFELAEDVAALGEVEKARELLERVRLVAREAAPATLVDAEMLAERLSAQPPKSASLQDD